MIVHLRKLLGSAGAVGYHNAALFDDRDPRALARNKGAHFQLQLLAGTVEVGLEQDGDRRESASEMGSGGSPQQRRRTEPVQRYDDAYSDQSRK